MSNSRKNILFSLTGSIACFKACLLISELVKEGHQVQVVATKGALKFVGEMTLEGLTRKRVLSSTYDSGEAMQHIDLIKWSDLIITCPISANRINQFHAGHGDDLLSALFLSYDFKRPWFLIPAMNPNMYTHPMTQNSVGKLKELGFNFLGPDKGEVACGDVGPGRMLEPQKILESLQEFL